MRACAALGWENNAYTDWSDLGMPYSTHGAGLHAWLHDGEQDVSASALGLRKSGPGLRMWPQGEG